MREGSILDGSEHCGEYVERGHGGRVDLGIVSRGLQVLDRKSILGQPAWKECEAGAERDDRMADSDKRKESRWLVQARAREKGMKLSEPGAETERMG